MTANFGAALTSGKAETKTTLVCFAVTDEARPFDRFARSMPNVAVVVTGMGRDNAARSCRTSLQAHKPGLVITAGFAGGLDSGLASGAILFDADSNCDLEARLLAAGAKSGRFACVGRIAVTGAEKRDLRYQTGADAVEMESEAIRLLCREQGVPSATVRVILDTADQDLPLDFNALLTPDMRLSIPKLAVSVLARPGAIPSLMALQRQTRASAEALARLLQAVLT